MSKATDRAFAVVVMLAGADDALTLADLTPDGETERQTRRGVDVAVNAGLARHDRRRGGYVATGSGRAAMAQWPGGEA